MREVCPEARFYQASSSEMFGKVLRGAAERDGPRSIRARPTAWPRPTATSSRSTTASPTACTRPAGSCSTTSPRARGLEFVTRKITWHAAAIKLGLDVRAAPRQPRRRARLGLRRRLRAGDVADAAAGPARGLRDRHRRRRTPSATASRSPSTMPASPVDDHVEIDPALLRPAEVEHLVGDASKARQLLGWEPQVELRAADPDDGRLRSGAAAPRARREQPLSREAEAAAARLELGEHLVGLDAALGRMRAGRGERAARQQPDAWPRRASRSRRSSRRARSGAG